MCITSLHLDNLKFSSKVVFQNHGLYYLMINILIYWLQLILHNVIRLNFGNIAYKIPTTFLQLYNLILLHQIILPQITQIQSLQLLQLLQFIHLALVQLTLALLVLKLFITQAQAQHVLPLNQMEILICCHVIMDLDVISKLLHQIKFLLKVLFHCIHIPTQVLV